MFKVYEIVRITVGKNADQSIVKLVASVVAKYSR